MLKLPATILAFKSCSYPWCQVLSKHSCLLDLRQNLQFPIILGKSFSFLCLKISEWHCRINLALLCPFRHCRKLSTPFGIQQIGSQNCSSAYERCSVLKSHEYCSRKKSSWGKRNCSLSSQGPDLLILSNYHHCPAMRDFKTSKTM